MKLKIFFNLFFTFLILAISFFIVFIYTNYQEFIEKSTSNKFKPTVFNKDGKVNYNNLPLFNTNNNPIYDLTIVFPAYKEKNRLPKTLKNILNYLKTLNIKFEIIIVNDGSPDETLEIIKNNIKKYKEFPITGITYEKNAGKGFAVKTGISYARGKYILMMDADDAFDHNDINDLYQMIKGKNNLFLVGSRKINEKISDRKWYRNIMGIINHFVINQLIGVGDIKDTQCGFKFFTADAAQKIVNNLHISRWAFDVDMLYIARKKNIEIKEVPVHFRDVEGSQLNIITAVISFFRDYFSMIVFYNLGIWKIQ